MVIGLFLVLVLISAATGCTAVWDTGATEDKKQSGAQPAEEPVVLHVYNTMGENINTEQAEAYIHRTMPGVKIESTYEIAPKMENAQLAAVRSGGGPEILYTQDYYTYVQSGYLKDLTSEPFLKNYMISALNDAEVGGKVYASGWKRVYLRLMVNRQLLADMGYDMPRTQEEFIGSAAGFRREGRRPGYGPMPLGCFTMTQQQWWPCPFFWMRTRTANMCSG